MKKINESTKVTLTLKQLKKLVKESKGKKIVDVPQEERVKLLEQYWDTLDDDTWVPANFFDWLESKGYDLTGYYSDSFSSKNNPYEQDEKIAMKRYDWGDRGTIVLHSNPEDVAPDNDTPEEYDDYEPSPCTAVINGKTRTFTNFDRFLKVLSKHLNPRIDLEDFLSMDVAEFDDHVVGREKRYFDGSVTKVTVPDLDELM